MREVVMVALLGLAAAQHYPKGPADHISENDIDKQFCKSSHECKYGEVCQRVCLWQEYTKKFTGCKIQCVAKADYPHPKDYKHEILPFALPHEVHVPVNVPYKEPKPQYHPPEPKKYPSPCQSDYDCGHNMHCTYGKECVCKYGFQPDPHDPHRCIDLKPSYGKPKHAPKPTYHPEPKPSYHPPPPKYPEPKYAPKPYHPPPPKYEPAPYHPPAPKYPEPKHAEPYAAPKPTYEHGQKSHPPPPRTCHSEHDCGYGEKCCYWRKCNAYNICAVEYKCAKYC